MYVSLPCSWQGRIIINFSGNTRGYKACKELWWGFELYIKFETHHPLIMPISQIPSLLLTKEHLLRWLESILHINGGPTVLYRAGIGDPVHLKMGDGL